MSGFAGRDFRCSKWPLDENAKLRDSLTFLHRQFEDMNAELEHLRLRLDLRTSRALFAAAARMQVLKYKRNNLQPRTAN